MKKVLILAACAFLLCCCTDSDSSSVGASVEPSAENSADSSVDSSADSSVDKSDESGKDATHAKSSASKVKCSSSSEKNESGDKKDVDEKKGASENKDADEKKDADEESGSSTKRSSSSSVADSADADTTDYSAAVTPNSSASVVPSAKSSSSVEYAPGFRESSESDVASRCKSYTGDRGFRWIGEEGVEWVETDLDNGTKSSGYWYDVGDSLYGGMSKIEWPEERGTVYNEDSFEPIVGACNGICGTYKLNKGTYAHSPYVGFAFNVAGVYPEYVDGFYVYTPAQPADVTDWGGLCVVYYSDADSTFLELSMGDTLDAAAGYILPRVHLPKSFGPREFCARWSSFKAPAVSSEAAVSEADGEGDAETDGESLTVTGTEAAKNLATIRFVIQGEDGETGEFNLREIGGYCW